MDITYEKWLNKQKIMKKVLIVGAGRIAGLNEFDNYCLKPCTHIGAFNNHKDFM